jgi:hypothetical protein
MGQISLTTTEVEKVLTGRYHSFIQDIADSTAPQAVLADTEYLFTVDGLARNAVVAPDYITSRWDATNNKFAVPEELNTPTYVADLSFTFTPDVSSAGTVIIRVYIDDTVPKQIRSSTRDYKGDPESINTILTWYLGEEAGYDAKNDGVYFTVEFAVAGSISSKGVVIYRT